MAATDLPNQKQKQAILYKPDARPEELRSLGRKFLENGWMRDAILFLSKARDHQSLEEIRRQVIEEGDTFLFRQVILALDQTAAEGEWRQLGDRALALGKLQFAREAFRMIGDRKSIDKIDNMIDPQAAEAGGSSGEESGEETGEETGET